MTKTETVEFCDKIKAQYPFDFEKSYQDVYCVAEKIPAEYLWRALKTEAARIKSRKTRFSFETMINNAAQNEGYSELVFEIMKTYR